MVERRQIIMDSRYGFVLAALLCSIVTETFAITREQFFGERTVDTPMLVANDDDSSTEITLSVPYPFFDKPRSVIYVNNNGALTFSDRAPSYSDIEFPRNPYQLIAQFWGDVDTRVTGTVWYMESTNQALLDRATDYVRRGFVTAMDFRPTHLFIATWEDVGYYNMRADKNNTFQTILATDSVDLYVIYLYANIDWTTGDSNGGDRGLGGTPAQVGFNAGDWLNSFSVRGSRTDDIRNIDDLSNIDMAGVWVFHVSGATVRSGGCTNTSNPALTLSPSYGNILGGETVSVTGPCFEQTDLVQCEFDGIKASAIFVSKQEVLCVSPKLSRSGRVTFRLSVNGRPLSQKQFMSIPIENAYQVNVLTPNEKVTISSNEEIQLQWSPQSIFPRNTSSDFQVTIAMYGLDMENGEWNPLHVFHSNTANDGQETVVIPDNLDPEILPILFRVSASINPASTVRSGTLYTELVRTGQSPARWSSQYFYVNPLVTTQTGYHLCQSWYEGEPENVGAELLAENSPCPPRAVQAGATNSGMERVSFSSFFGSSLYQRQWLDSFHPGATSCFTGNQRSSTSMTSSTQQCCYDDAGDLITGAPGGGAINRVSLATSRLRHFQQDVRPYLLCCTGFAPSCQKYYEHRPSQGGRGYQPPLPAWVFGDPHLVTLDGHKYTFNGKGEFTLINTLNDVFTLQGRMQQLNNNVSATVLTAIAGKEFYSDRVMIAQGRQGVDIYVNGEIVDLRLVRRQEFRNVTLMLTDDRMNDVVVTFSSGVAVNARLENGFISFFNVVMPPVYRGITQGLLGFYDGDPSNDLWPRNGLSPLPISTEASRIHELFGLTWILTDLRQSLFTYRPYENFTNLRDPAFEPRFTVNLGSADVSACNGDPFCEYDVVTTGNAQVGVATLATVSAIQETVQLSYPVICDPPCVNGACVANNTCACSAGYTGSLCNSFTDVRSCDLNPCADGEKCAVVTGSYLCTPNCDQTPLSPLCLVIASGPCDVNHCNNGGICRPSNDTTYGFECTCPTGLTGRPCDVVATTTVCPCQNGGICVGDNNSCMCPEGYSGDRCENGATVSMYVIIGASIGGGVLLAIIIFLLLCIVVIVACNRSTRMKTGHFSGGVGENKDGTIRKTTDTAENANQDTAGSYHSNAVSQTPANPVQPVVPVIHVQENLYVNQEPPVQERQYEQIRDARPPQPPVPQNRGPHDVTPPPPYTEEWQRHNSNQNHNVQTDNAQSDSSSINGSGIDIQVLSHTDSSRSNSASPNGDKESLGRTESLQKHSISSQERVCRTPSPGSEIPLTSHSHSNSQQNIPIRSTASTPCQGPGSVGMKRNLTVPRNWLSLSSGHLGPARRPVRRYSSSSTYLTSVVSDDSGQLTMVTEV